jgi:hypothetical protein
MPDSFCYQTPSRLLLASRLNETRHINWDLNKSSDILYLSDLATVGLKVFFLIIALFDSIVNNCSLYKEHVRVLERILLNKKALILIFSIRIKFPLKRDIISTSISYSIFSFEKLLRYYVDLKFSCIFNCVLNKRGIKQLRKTWIYSNLRLIFFF